MCRHMTSVTSQARVEAVVSKPTSAKAIMDMYQGLGDKFTPDLAIDLVRSNLSDTDTIGHMLCDVIEALTDENERLNRILNGFKVKKGKK